ncbi:hypothetical protein WH297_12955 [Ochrobactrum vermis]|uniref:Transcriptional regulator n=1 Tax=Ochrobactrum vermis TaxID=1827297 RepID=A0ABU8PG63_9HYPH|nr:hypothetical protein [Ochrobactrum vermis]PQZ30937.1 hypothetical protein CQZ93_13160 [Ochrobactrum vermis]
MTAYEYPLDSLSRACGHTETETEMDTETGERKRERNRNVKQRRKRQTESETTDRRRVSKAEIVVPHQGYIALDCDTLGNRIHLKQAWLGYEESKITIVGIENLDALIAALNEARERLV